MMELGQTKQDLAVYGQIDAYTCSSPTRSKVWGQEISTSVRMEKVQKSQSLLLRFMRLFPTPESEHATPRREPLAHSERARKSFR